MLRYTAHTLNQPTEGDNQRTNRRCIDVAQAEKECIFVKTSSEQRVHGVGVGHDGICWRPRGPIRKVGQLTRKLRNGQASLKLTHHGHYRSVVKSRGAEEVLQNLLVVRLCATRQLTRAVVGAKPCERRGKLI